MSERRREGSQPDRMVIADASTGRLAVPTFFSRWGVVGEVDKLTGAPVVRPQDEAHFDHRQVRVHDMQQRTPAGVPDRRVSLQVVNDYGAPYADVRPGDSPYAQAELFTALNRSTREVDGSKVALPASHRRIVGSEDGRYAIALTLNEIDLGAPGEKDERRGPDGAPVVDLPLPEGVAFREPSPGAQGLRALRGVVVGGLFIQGEAAQNAARAAINGGGDAGDVARWALAASKGQPPPALEGRNLPATTERTAAGQDDPDAPAGPAPIQPANKPAGYVRGPSKTGLLGSFFTTEASSRIHVGRGGEEIGTLPARHDYQIALDAGRRVTLGINDKDCAGTSEGEGVEVKGWLEPDSSQAGADTQLPGKDGALRPVIRVPKPDPITVPPPLPPRGGAQCEPPKKPTDPPEEAGTGPDAKDAISAAEKAEAAANAAANAAKAKADAALVAANAAKADPDARAGQGGDEERNAAGAAANAAREARAARRAAEAAHEAVELAKSRGEAAQRAVDAANASGTGSTSAIARTHQRRAVEAANKAARAAAQAAERAQRAADRSARANTRASRAALQAAQKARARAEREARLARSERIKAEKEARDFPDSAEAKAKAAEAREAELAADRAALSAADGEQQARNRLEEAKKDEPSRPEPVADKADEADQQDAEHDKEEEAVAGAIGKCAAEEAKKADDDAPFIVIGGHPDGSRWVPVHEGDDSLLIRKIGPGGTTMLGALRIGPNGKIENLDDNGEKQATITATGGITLKEQTAPSTPPTGYVEVYVKNDGKLYIKDDAGTETDTTAAGASLGYMIGTPIHDNTTNSAFGDFGDWGWMLFDGPDVGSVFIQEGVSGASASGNYGPAHGQENSCADHAGAEPQVTNRYHWFTPRALPPAFVDVGPNGLTFRIEVFGLTGETATIELSVYVVDPSDGSTEYGPFNATQYSADQAWTTFQVDQADLAGLWTAGDTPNIYLEVQSVTGGNAVDGLYYLSIGTIQLDLDG